MHILATIFFKPAYWFHLDGTVSLMGHEGKKMRWRKNYLSMLLRSLAITFVFHWTNFDSGMSNFAFAYKGLRMFCEGTQRFCVWTQSF